MGVFPEGRRVTYWGEEATQRGAAWLALRTGVPLLPVAIVGADATLSPAHPGFARSTVGVWVQPPLDPAAFVDRPNPVTALGEAWAASIAERLDPWTDPPPGEHEVLGCRGDTRYLSSSAGAGPEAGSLQPGVRVSTATEGC